MEKYEKEKANIDNQNKKPEIYEERFTTRASSKLYAYIYLDNADKNKYESILKNFN